MPYNRNTNRKFNNDMVAGINQYLNSEQCKADRKKQATIAKSILPKYSDELELSALAQYFGNILNNNYDDNLENAIDDSEQKHYEQFMHKSEAQIKDMNTPPPKNGIAHASIDINGKKHYEVNPNEAKRLDDILARIPNKNMWEYA